MEEIKMSPIGFVKNSVKIKKDVSWGEDTSVIELKEEYHSGLKGLEDFSHAIILFYLDKASYDSKKHLNRRQRRHAACGYILSKRKGQTKQDRGDNG